ncbi:MAG: HAD hydrolase-like protein [Vibrio sp.]|uniref:HAD family hydrolase n=1 Tax=Vibrio TaxID=662 RepID=UPI0019D0E9D3|nr:MULTISPECIES: HAD hydrolase-like protein [Vibrio]MBN3572464.1 HAD hydrolase-like protein [Vibrio neptunius]NRB69955.1 HAD hydrolase-like protein [Vibrio sp.]
MKHHVMLDIDGTLLQSYEMDEQCFVDAVRETTGLEISTDWGSYPFVTDRGILKTFIQEQGLKYSLAELESIVKPIFIRNVQQSVARSPAQEVSGAKKFVSYLLDSDEYVVSIATGGWGETAKIKLESAGFETEKLAIMSSNDHYSRIKIMELAKSAINQTDNYPVTYFGDAEWDLEACKELAVNVVIVGDRVNHYQRIQDFNCLDTALSFVK